MPKMRSQAPGLRQGNRILGLLAGWVWRFPEAIWPLELLHDPWYVLNVPLSRTLSSAELRGLCLSVTALSDFCEQEQRINEGAYTNDWSNRCKEWLWRSQEELSLCIIERYICLLTTHTLDVNFLVFV